MRDTYMYVFNIQIKMCLYSETYRSVFSCWSEAVTINSLARPPPGSQSQVDRGSRWVGGVRGEERPVVAVCSCQVRRDIMHGGWHTGHIC